VIVGAGFAGYRTARTLARLTRHKADITLLNPTDYFLYLPLLPQVAAGVLEPRRVTVSLPGTLPHVRLVLGEADGIDLDARTVHYTDPESEPGTLTYDRLVLAVGGVNKLLALPDPYVQVPGRPEAYACGDAAAIPLSGPPPGPSPAALDTASPEPARAAGSPRDFASRPEGDS
jgi:NADH dehydrogenase FAD-containing subunit